MDIKGLILKAEFESIRKYNRPIVIGGPPNQQEDETHAREREAFVQGAKFVLQLVK